MHGLGEALARRRAHALRGRVGRAQLRVLALELQQLLEETVVLRVGNLGRGLVVVEAVVAPHRPAPLLRLFGQTPVPPRGTAPAPARRPPPSPGIPSSARCPPGSGGARA